MKTKTTAFLLTLACLAAALPARAIQLSLEENRQETGHIGFIDMQRLFQQFPETIRAKENFEEVVRRSEEQVNIRKVELIHLRNDLDQLKAERKLLAQLQAPVVAAVAPAAPAAVKAPPLVAVSSAAAVAVSSAAPAVAASKPAPAPAPVAAAPKTVMAPVAIVGGSGPAPVAMAPTTTIAAAATAKPMAALPGFGEAASDMPGQSFGWKPAAASPAPAAKPAVAQAGPPARPAPANQPLIINIPGISTAPIVVQPPVAASAATGSSSPEASVSASVSATHAVVAATESAAKPAVSTAAVAGAVQGDKKSAELAEMDVKIASKEKDLAREEADFNQYQSEAEKNLLDLESRKTEILLGKIHKAIEDVAREEGVSVVVDKTNILYGHDAVDLTDKVLKYLKSS